jgi:predicted nucleotidyltransferase
MFSDVKSRHWRILEEFFEDPELETSLRELSRRTGISPGWISENIEILSDKDFIEINEDDISKKMSIGGRFQELKEVYNLKEIRESGITEHLNKELRPDALILFGTFERGEDLKDSDIDIAVINGRDKKPDLTSFEEKLGRKIELQHIQDVKESDENFRNSLANGKTLSGFAELV